MVSDCNTSMDTLSEGSNIENETVETSDLEELEDDDYLPVPRDPLLRAHSPMDGGDNISARAGQAPSDSDDSESDFASFHQQWTSDPEQFKRRDRNAYNLNPRPSTTLPNEAKAVDYFKEFWDQALIEKLTAETSVYMQFGCIFWIHAFYLCLGINILTLDTCCCLYWIMQLKCPLQDNYRSVTFLTIPFLYFNEFSKFFLHNV